jgi:AraC-like DNA-binding protein
MNSPLSQVAGRYREWEPAVALRDHVYRVWENDLARSSGEEYRVVPDGCVDILWTGANLLVAGPDTHPIVEKVQPGSRVIGLRFFPGAAHRWLGVPLSEILNRRVPLEEFWKADAGALADRLSAAQSISVSTTILQQGLIQRLVSVGQADSQIAFLRRRAAGLKGDLDIRGIRDLSRRLGISERTLRRRCLDAYGYGYKTLQRILRFQRLFGLVRLSKYPNLADLAADAGFADQAHMTREMSLLCGATPTWLVAQLVGWPISSRRVCEL